MAEKFSEAVGAVVQDFSWLIVDALVLLLLLGSLLAYKDFDDSMRLLIRGVLVYALGLFWISGFHLLVYLRRSDRQKAMPGLASYTFYMLKFILFMALVFWAAHREAI